MSDKDTKRKPGSGGTIVNLNEVRERQHAMSLAEEDIIQLYEEELKNTSTGSFNMFGMEDGSTRITATIPAGMDPEEFVLDQLHKSKGLSQLF